MAADTGAQQFIGTEFTSPDALPTPADLAAGAQDDPTARIRELTRRRDEIDREDRTRCAGRAGPLDATQ